MTAATGVIYLNRHEAAKLLGLSVADWVELCRNRKAPKAVRVKGKSRWKKEDILAFRTLSLESAKAWLASCRR